MLSSNNKEKLCLVICLDYDNIDVRYKVKRNTIMLKIKTFAKVYFYCHYRLTSVKRKSKLKESSLLCRIYYVIFLAPFIRMRRNTPKLILLMNTNYQK